MVTAMTTAGLPSRTPSFVLVAGATGSLGRHVTSLLRARGSRVRLLSRRDRPEESARDGGIECFRGDVLEPATLAGCCDGVDAVVSCLGASLDLYAWKDRLSYSRIDAEGNLALVESARAAGVPKFAYVSVFAEGPIEQTAYVRAHRAVERGLDATPMDARIVRPTGFFSFLDELIRMARRGVVPLIGDGSARTNPIDEAELAGFVVDSLAGTERIVEAGGPDILTRAEIAALAAEAVGGKVRTLHSPPSAWLAGSRLLRKLQPRLSELLEFAAIVSTNNGIAPQKGRRRLADHFRGVASKAQM
jgi:uncharacterized protein YbjT (DUF2867 family)